MIRQDFQQQSPDSVLVRLKCGPLEGLLRIHWTRNFAFLLSQDRFCKTPGGQQDSQNDTVGYRSHEILPVRTFFSEKVLRAQPITVMAACLLFVNTTPQQQEAPIDSQPLNRR
jgi:hypothetical protein